MRVDKFYISDGFLETGLTYITGITESIGSSSTDNEIPTAKAVYEYGGGSSGSSYWEAGTTGTNSIKTIGGNNTSSGDYSVAEGYQTLATGGYSHSEGRTTIASGERAHSEGLSTTASGDNSHAEGSLNLASGLNAHAQNNNTTAGGKMSHAGGWGYDNTYKIIADGYASFNHSTRLDATPDVSGVSYDSHYSAILGGTNQSINNGENAGIIGGSDNVVSHDRSVILGGENQTTDAVDTVYAMNLRVGSTTIGDYTGGNYTEFESDGTMIAYGSATTWTDLTFPLTTTKQGNTSLPNFDYTNVCYLFPEDDEDEKLYGVGQFPHSIMHGTPIRPHYHWIQESVAQSDTTFSLTYLISNPGEVEGSWLTITGNTTEFAYVSGSTHQITALPEITTTNTGLPITFSAILRVKLFRTAGDGVTGDVKVTDFDVHFQEDMMGTREEYTKY